MSLVPGEIMKPLKVVAFAFSLVLSGEASSKNSPMEPCEHIKVEIIEVGEEEGREVGVIRITNSGDAASNYDLSGVDPTRRYPLLDFNSYTVYTRGPSSQGWTGRLLIGTFSAPTGRLTIEPKQAVLVAADVAKAYRKNDYAGEDVYIKVISRDPVCYAESAEVRVSEIPRRPSMGW